MHVNQPLELIGEGLLAYGVQCIKRSYSLEFDS
jgi:hypothetical protein